MAQNIYDQRDFFEGYSGLARSVKGLDGAPEWPAIRAMLPALDGRRIVDKAPNGEGSAEISDSIFI